MTDDKDGTDRATLEIFVKSANETSTLSFPNGTDGYNGMIDATIRSDDAAGNAGSAATI